MTSSTVQQRIALAKDWMSQHDIQVLLVPTEDPHMSEYPADHWKLREYLSGFTGSNGFLVISQWKNALWTDSRYFLQAANQLEGSSIQLMKEGTDDPTWMEWIKTEIPPHSTIGLNGLLFSHQTVEELQTWCKENSYSINTKVPSLFEDKLPPLPSETMFIHDTSYGCNSFSEKKEELFLNTTADYILLTALDEIAWTFNIRGKDTRYNPVVLSYAIVGKDESYICVDNRKLTPEVCQYFAENHITCLFAYESIFDLVAKLSHNSKVSADPHQINYQLFQTIKRENLVIEKSPVILAKSIKREGELQAIRNAHLKDGVALVKAFYQIETELSNCTALTEIDIDQRLKKQRSEQADFFCESFATIAGYGAHGAIVHYSATEESCATIGTDSLLLVDSGANYLDGTTDITRVFCYGTPTKRQRTDYTLVLKGHIAIARCKFPKGTEGAHINALAHQSLWNEGLDFGHGTGHGVGFFLCVHEGPQRINNRFTGTHLVPGMIITDEPGLYRTGEHGIRIENMMAVQPWKKNEFGEFFQFETLTLFPYEPKLIDPQLLTQEEIDWVNTYHQKVYETLSPYLSNDECLWLKNVTKELK